MFARIQDFLTRHRRKFIITGVLVGGTIIVAKYAQRKFIEMQEQQAREFFERTRRMQHFESTERTCNQVILGMGAELCQAVLRECSTDGLLEQLRQNPPNKIELWEEMKIVSFTRLTTFIYASSMLVIALRVQLNLLGGYIYRDITTEQKKITDELKQQYLSLIRHFISEGGLAELVKFIRIKVLAILKSTPLTRQLTLTDIEQIFWSLQMSINGDDKQDPNAKMSKYVLPANPPDYCISAPLLKTMYNETLDLLESEDVTGLCASNISRGFSLAADAIADSIGDTLQHMAPSATSNSIDPDKQQHNNNNAVLNINNVPLALAKLIPIISGLTSRGYDGDTRPHNLPTSLLTFYVVAEKCKTLGANIYETFSSS